MNQKGGPSEFRTNNEELKVLKTKQRNKTTQSDVYKNKVGDIKAVKKSKYADLCLPEALRGHP